MPPVMPALMFTTSPSALMKTSFLATIEPLALVALVASTTTLPPALTTALPLASPLRICSCVFGARYTRGTSTFSPFTDSVTNQIMSVFRPAICSGVNGLPTSRVA
ncbi:hypothetical protein D3C87_1703330 [compost metagenome]